MQRSWSAWVLVVASMPALAQTVYVNDPLTAATATGRGGSRGGSFGADGWTVTAEDDTVWYEIDQALPSARIEFTVTGLAHGTGGSLTGADHDLVTFYQAPTGYAEPVQYSPQFRNNDFKAFIRIFGNQEPGREGAMKLELAACPRGEPWYHDTACPAGCEFSGIGYALGSPVDVGWDATRSYRLVVEWSPGTMTLSRDGTTLGSVSFSGTYAPRPLRVRFGSPRHQGVSPGVAMMPLGIKVKDVVIAGTPGAMTPVCGAAPVDAGTGGGAGGGAGGGSGGGSGGTGGGTGGGGGSVSSSGEYAVLADVTAASWETGVFPDVMDLNVEGPGAAHAYLRFPALGGAVERATLVLRTHATSSAAGGSGRPCAVADSSWQETTLTWATRPATGACAGAERSVDSDMEVEWDVTPLVQPGAPVNLALTSNDANGVHYLSKEAGGATQGPRLRVLLAPAADAGVTPDAGTGASDAGAGDAGAGDGGLVGTPPTPPVDGGDGGPGNIAGQGSCGCAAAPVDVVLALALSALGARRRRWTARG